MPYCCPPSLAHAARCAADRPPRARCARYGRRWGRSYLDGQLPLPYVHLLTLMAKFNVELRTAIAREYPTVTPSWWRRRTLL